MAEGFLHQPDRLMESFGGECFEELVSRSFFQYATNNKSRYSMHDLINDLARTVAGEFFFMLDANDQDGAIGQKFHHLSIIREYYGAHKKFKALQRARRLRTFLATSVNQLNYWDRFYVSNKVLIELLPQMKFLRVLSLANYKITESLLLSGCRLLSSLPNTIVKLINLRHLDISDTPKLKKMPSGLGRLTDLRTLSRVIIGGSGEFRLSDLKDLVHLRGLLSIEGLHNVKDVLHAKERTYN
ncbi:putative disease resistance RPP13-like protein 1 [Bidens hawaiensis]|uniref:putative disease resistance RPP13-like protein 1 n=1 Tax=Bidens hawaiensis TaxID=980011 RepID=UPI004049E41B